jgi:putative isomerase
VAAGAVLPPAGLRQPLQEPPAAQGDRALLLDRRRGHRSGQRSLDVHAAAEELGFHLPELPERDADELKAAIRKHCWDERDGFFYSVDLNQLPFEARPFSGDPRLILHSGYPRDYDCLIQRLGVWSGFLLMWSGIATPEQARRMVAEHYRNEKTFNAPFGVRTLSKMEKMYNVRASGNPSLWTGPIWGISNYLVFRGLVEYGREADARDPAEKTIRLFACDFERFGALHEYYLPDSGEPVLSKGFQNWNYLVLNMAAWYEGRPVVHEF